MSRRLSALPLLACMFVAGCAVATPLETKTTGGSHDTGTASDSELPSTDALEDSVSESDAPATDGSSADDAASDSASAIDSATALDATASDSASSTDSSTLTDSGSLTDSSTVTDSASATDSATTATDAAADAVVDGGTVVLDFPTSADTPHTMLTNYWNLGDYIEGVRATSLSSTTSATIHIVVSPDSLTCDTQDMKLMINGTEAGRFSIHATPATVDATFTYAAISGPSYTLRYETVRTVSSGCGSAGFAMTGGTITLH
jgi:hypothetical protein